MSVLIHPQHSSPPQSSAASCMLDCWNDTNNLFGHSFGLRLFLHVFPLFGFLPLDTGAPSKSKLMDAHAESHTPIEYTHTHALFTQVPALLIVLSAKLGVAFCNVSYWRGSSMFCLLLLLGASSLSVPWPTHNAWCYPSFWIDQKDQPLLMGALQKQSGASQEALIMK